MFDPARSISRWVDQKSRCKVDVIYLYYFIFIYTDVPGVFPSVTWLGVMLTWHAGRHFGWAKIWDS